MPAQHHSTHLCVGEPGRGEVAGERYSRSDENARDSVVLGDRGRPAQAPHMIRALRSASGRINYIEGPAVQQEPLLWHEFLHGSIGTLTSNQVAPAYDYEIYVQ